MAASAVAAYDRDMSKLEDTLGSAFKEIRVRTEKTQERFAERTGLSQTHISALERGRSWGLKRVAQALDTVKVDPGELLRRAAGHSQLPEDLAEIAIQWGNIDPAVRGAILILVRDQVEKASQRKAG